MSRIGKKPIQIPQGVTVTVNGLTVEVKGPKGTLSIETHSTINVKVEDNTVVVERTSETKTERTLHGTVRSLINNMVIGVSEGYKKQLSMVGVGYRAQVSGNTITVSAGYSNPVEVAIPKGLTVEVEKNTNISVSGIDKQAVGEFAANIRAIRKPEPYLGKGIRYVDERVRRKEGKTAK
ncbi:MAG: 50S ribosomal protein L6 [Bacillota bacterium]